MVRKYNKKLNPYWLSPQQVADKFGISRPAVMKYIKEGKLKAKNFTIKGLKMPRYRMHIDWVKDFKKRELKWDN